MSKKVGVVVPVFNTEKYLRQCLDSVCNQSYKNLEIVLVNDGSTDSSFNIAKEYALKDSRIVLIDKENGGLSSARNAGLEYLAKEYALEFSKEVENFCEFKITNSNALKIKAIYKAKTSQNSQSEAVAYLQFVDSDDYIDLECIEKCVEKIAGVDIVWFDIKTFLDGVKKSDWHSNLHWLGYKDEVIISRNDWLRRLWLRKMEFFYFSWQGLIDFDFLKRIKLKFINGILQEDDHFGILLFSQANYIRIFPKKFYHYRIRPGSTMNYSKNIKDINIFIFFRDKLEIFKDKKLTRDYHIASSFTQTCLAIVEFLKGSKDEKIIFVLTKVLQTYIFKALALLNFDKDPLNLLEKIKTLIPYADFSETNLKKVASKQLEEELKYSLGTYILNSRTKNLFKLIKELKKMIKQDKEKRKAFIKNSQNYEISVPNLREYSDFTRVKTHLSYKLGIASFKALNKPLGSFILPFSMLFAYMSYAKQRQDKNLQTQVKALNQRLDFLNLFVQKNFTKQKHYANPQENFIEFINALVPNELEQEYFYRIFTENIDKKDIICVECNANKGKMIDFELLFAEKIYVFEPLYDELLKCKYKANSNIILEKKAVVYENFKLLPSEQEGNGVLPLEFRKRQGELPVLDFKTCLDDILKQHERIGILSLRLDFYTYKIIDILIDENYTSKISYVLFEVDEIFKESELFEMSQAKADKYGFMLWGGGCI